MKLFLTAFSPIQLALIAILLLSFLTQLYYYLVIYNRIPRHRHNRTKLRSGLTPPISVLVVVQDEQEYLEKYLPKLLTQIYPEYEVVVVADCSAEDTLLLIEDLEKQHPNLRHTVIQPDETFKHTRKLSLNIGIKACRHEHILFTEPNTYPPSEKWLSYMAQGFDGGSIVIGYCGYEYRKGIFNRYIRCTRLCGALRFLSAAISGKTYKGMAQNIGYCKSLYFAKRGFNHLKMNIGYDDLFIQTIATRTNTSVILNPNATLRELPYTRRKPWREERKYLTSTYAYYPSRVKASIAIELVSRFLVGATAVGLIVWGLLAQNWILTGSALAIIVLRLAATLWTVSRCAKRLGERHLLAFYPIYDLIAPLSECCLYLARRLNPSKGIWIN